MYSTARAVHWGRSVRYSTGLTALAGLSTLVFLALWATVPALVLGWNSTVVTSGSMAPAIDEGDTVLVQPGNDHTISEGAIVTFEDPTASAVTLHRVVAQLDDGRLVTKGDANLRPDSTPIEVGRIRGVARLMVPFVGAPAVWVSQENWTALAIAASALLAALWCARWAFDIRETASESPRRLWLTNAREPRRIDSMPSGPPAADRVAAPDPEPPESPGPAELQQSDASASFVALARVASNPRVLEVGLQLERQDGVTEVALTSVDLPNAWFTFRATDAALQAIHSSPADLRIWRETEAGQREADVPRRPRVWDAAAASIALVLVMLVWSLSTPATASFSGATANTGDALQAATIFYLHNDPYPPVGDTVSHALLPMQWTPPSATTLYNYDTDEDSEVGRGLPKTGDGLAETDPRKFQMWRYDTTGALSLGGPATVDLWSAMKDFNTVKRGIVLAGLYDCATDGSNCTTIATASLDFEPWDSGATGTWVFRTLDLGTVSYTVPASRSLRLKIVVEGDSDDDIWFAYDTTAYPSVLTIVN